MNKFFAVFIALLATTSWAKTIEFYDIYDSGEKQPHWITIEKDNSVVTRIQISLQHKDRTIVLFDIDKKSLKKDFKVITSGTSLTVDGQNSIKSSFQGTYNNPWGDAPVVKNGDYTLSFNLTDGCLVELKDEWDLCYLELGSNTHEEMAMWGNLIRRK